MLYRGRSLNQEKVFIRSSMGDTGFQIVGGKNEEIHHDYG